MIVCAVLALGSFVMGFGSYGSYQDNKANMEYNLAEMENAIIVGDSETAALQSDWALEASAIVEQRKLEMALFFFAGLIFTGIAVFSGLRSKKA